MDTAIVALGGNALINSEEHETDEKQFEVAKETVKGLKKILKNKETVLTHGNGPQVGNLYLQQEFSKKDIPKLPLHTCVAMTQGQIGYYLQKAMNKEDIDSVSIVTQVVVNSKDPSFHDPKKPIGPYYKKKKNKWNMVKKRKGWRRVVPSPKPLKVVELNEIKSLLKEGFTTIACGGGGIPVVKEGKSLHGVDAVIDKDRATALLGKSLEIDEMYMVTNVPYVYRGYGGKNQEKINKMNLNEAKEMMVHGEFGEGSMKPKIESAIDFLESGGEKVVITNVKNASKILKGEGTKLTR